MKKLILLAAIIGAIVYGTLFHGKIATVSQPPLPPELAQIQCQKDSKFVAPEGYNVIRVAGTTLVFACYKQGDPEGLEKAWQKEQYADGRYTGGPYFKKRPDGAFEVSDDARSIIPQASTARYSLETTIRPHEPEQWKQNKHYFPGRHSRITVATPAPFAATGPETTFDCFESFDWPLKCSGRVRSNTLYWSILIKFSRPRPNDAVPPPADDVAEAYNLLAAHILKQEK